jgi:hypothetical protein
MERVQDPIKGGRLSLHIRRPPSVHIGADSNLCIQYEDDGCFSGENESELGTLEKPFTEEVRMATGVGSSFPIELFYSGETFALNGAEVEDYYPAICRAQGSKPPIDEPDPIPDPVPGSWTHPFGTYTRKNGSHQVALQIVFQGKLYHFSHTIEIVRQVHLQGTLSGNGSFKATRFKFPPHTGGLILHALSSGYLRSKILSDGSIVSEPVRSTFTEGKMVDRGQPEHGMALYCGWNVVDFIPDPPASPDAPYNDALSINPQGSIIENIFFEGSNDGPGNEAIVRLDKPELLRDTFPDFKLLVTDADKAAGDRSSTGTTLLNPYENSGALNPADVENKINGQPYESWNEASKSAHGLTLFGISEIRSCTISKFSGHGIYIFGNNYQGNDLTILSRVDILFNNGDGVHIFGSDAGLITGTSISSTHNAGWGAVSISQSSAVTFISCNWSYNQKGGFLVPYQLFSPVSKVQAVDERSLKDLTDGEPAPASIPLPQKNLQSHEIDFILTAGGVVMIGSYSESNWSDPSKKNIGTENFMNFSSLLLGCTMGGLIDGHPQNFHPFDNNSLLNEGSFTGLGNRPSAIPPPSSPLDPGKPYDYSAATLGSNTFNNVGLSFSHRFINTPDKNHQYGLSTELLFQHREADYWGFCTVNGQAQSPLSISHWHNRDIGDGQLWLEKGLFIGPIQDPYGSSDPHKRIRMTVSTEADMDSTITSLGRLEGSSLPEKGSPNLYQWEEGDIILNKKPRAGGHVGWICCRDTTGTLRWFRYGSIDSAPGF